MPGAGSPPRERTGAVRRSRRGKDELELPALWGKRRSARWGQVCHDSTDGVRLGRDGHDLHWRLAARAGDDVDGEDAAQEPSPWVTRWRWGRQGSTTAKAEQGQLVWGRVVVQLRDNHFGTVGRVAGEHAVVAEHMAAFMGRIAGCEREAVG